MELFARHDSISSSEQNLQEPAESRALLELVLNFGRQPNNDSDDGGHESGPEDYFS